MKVWSDIISFFNMSNLPERSIICRNLFLCHVFLALLHLSKELYFITLMFFSFLIVYINVVDETLKSTIVMSLDCLYQCGWWNTKINIVMSLDCLYQCGWWNTKINIVMPLDCLYQCGWWNTKIVCNIIVRKQN